MSQPPGAPVARYSTRNTNLAACIGSCKIPVKTEQPVTITRDENTREVVVKFWFEDDGVEPFCGEIHKARALERYWSERETFEAANPNHPLTYMRRVLEKRDWLAHVWHGRIMPAASLDKPGLITQDQFFAAVLMALGFRLLRLDKPRYVFGGIPAAALRNIKEAYENFEAPGFIERPAALMRRVLEARAMLVAETKKPEVEKQLKFTDGITDEHGGRMAFISEKSTDEQISRTLDLLYKP